MGLFFDHGPLDAVTILAVLAGLIYYYLTSTYSFWESRGIPFIKPEILFGSVKDIVTFKMSQPEKFLQFHKHFRSMGLAYGGIYELRKPVLLLCTPDIIKDVTVKNFPSFHDRGMSYDEHFDPLTAHLILLEGQKWKYLRSKLAPAFTSGKLKAMITDFVEAGEPLLAVWDRAAETGDDLNIRELMAQYTTDVIGLCAFGLQLNSITDSKSRFRNMGRRIFEPSKTEKILQIVRNVYPWIYKTFKLRQYSKEITDFFIGTLREAMEYRKRNKVDKNDFLSFLMSIRDVKGQNFKDMDEMKGVTNYSFSVQDNPIDLTEGVIAAQAFIFFLAGFETSSTTLSFCLHELAYNPDIQERVQGEIDEALSKHNEIGIELLHHLTYMEQVLLETLRKYPPAPLIMRVCTKPYKLPDSETVLQPGTHVFIAPYSLHHDPEYFPEPEKFDPERFSPKKRGKMVPYSFIPFGEGPRICIGMRFAMLEMKTALVRILSRFTVVKCERTKPIRIDPRVFILTPIDGIWLRAVKRRENKFNL